MRKMIALLTMALFVVIGCESDNPVDKNESTERDYRISFESNRNQKNALVGDTLELDYKLFVYESESSAKAGIGEIYSLQKVPGISVTVELYDDEQILASETLVTDSTGYIVSLFLITVEKGYRGFYLRAETETDYASTYIDVIGYARPSRMILSAPTHTLTVPRGMIARMNISGTVIDETGSGISNLSVAGRIERAGGAPYGSMSVGSGTNSAGNFIIYYSSMGGFGTEDIYITSQVPDAPQTIIEEHFTVNTVALEDQIGSLNLYALPEQVILPDGGEVVLVLSALVLDNSARPLPGVRVNFDSDIGVIQSSSLTDSVGFAKIVWHSGVTPDTANITAYISGTDFMAQGMIDVRTQPATNDPVERVSLFSDDLTLIANSGGSTRVRALCQNHSGSLAEPGTVVGFEVLDGDGRFEVDRAVVNDQGEASVRFIVGTSMVVNRLRAFVEIGGGDRIESNDVRIGAVAGDAENFSMEIDPPTLERGGSADISISISDHYGNGVAGEVVRFTVTAGNVTRSVVTDASGHATGVIQAGMGGGVIELTWFWRERNGSTTITLISSTPNSISLSANPLNINPLAGDMESTLRAMVMDDNGASISLPTTVVFQLLNQGPDGCIFPNTEQIDSARTANGVAVMTLTSGAQAGAVVVKAYTWRDEERTDTVSTILGTIQVVNGPPELIELDIDSRGADAGGGFWDLPVSIRAYDRWQNPASGEFPITLTIVPDGVASIAPARLVDGIARTTLSYPSSSTFEAIRVNASIEAPQGPLDATLDRQLPLQRGFLTLAVDPQNWQFDRGRPDDTCTVSVWATLRDGHDQLINNAPIVFSTDRARLFWRNQVGGRMTMFFPSPARKYTGIRNANHSEEPGVATVYLRGKMSDFYLDDFTLEVTVHLEARVDGADVVADPESVFMTRH